MDDYGHIDNDTPSFAISLYKDYRGFEIVDENGEEYIMLCRLWQYDFRFAWQNNCAQSQQTCEKLQFVGSLYAKN